MEIFKKNKKAIIVIMLAFFPLGYIFGENSSNDPNPDIEMLDEDTPDDGSAPNNIMPKDKTETPIEAPSDNEVDDVSMQSETQDHQLGKNLTQVDQEIFAKSGDPIERMEEDGNDPTSPPKNTTPKDNDDGSVESPSEESQKNEDQEQTESEVTQNEISPLEKEDISSRLSQSTEIAVEDILPHNDSLDLNKTIVENNSSSPLGSEIEMPSAPPSPIENSSIDHFTFYTQIGGNYTYVNLQPEGHSSFGGSLGGLQALFAYWPENSYYGGIRFAYQQGVTHSGSGKRSLLYFDAQERVGYTFSSLRRNIDLTLFTGFGYRYIGQKFSPKQGDDLRFGYNEFYFPIGILSNYDINSFISLDINATWMPQVFPTVSIHPLKGNHWSLSSTFANVYVEVPVTFAVTKSHQLYITFTPFYEHWQDGHTTAKTTTGTSLGLPSNTYNFSGACLSFGYRF